MAIVIALSEMQVIVTLIFILILTAIWFCLKKSSNSSLKLDAKNNQNKEQRHNDMDSRLDDERTQTLSEADEENDKVPIKPYSVAKLKVGPIERILQASQCISDSSYPPAWYKLPVKITQTLTVGIEKAEVGTPHPTPKPTRVFMVVGATGAGKSTLVNGIVNYLMGVKFEDNYRFKLITDEVAESQAHSQTQKITSYTIYWHEESPVDYNLIIVDTPGFGDTRGIERDKQITAKVKEFFSLKGDAGIDQIHGIGFVTQSSLARLTHTQKYVFNAVLSIFGKDIENTIFIMSTFDDGSKPAVKEAIETAEIPYCKFLQFNNDSLFASNDSQFTKIFWGMAYESFKEFFIHFTRTDAVSLQLSRDVLKEREHLECIVAGLQQRIKDGVAKIDELNQVKQILKAHEADILKNKNFKYKVTVTRQRKVDISGKGTFVTNCQRCNFTCHKHCGVSDKRHCAVMISSGYCQVCPGRCFWTMHRNNPFYFETYEVEEERMLDDLKANLHDASMKQSSIQELRDKLEQEKRALKHQVFEDIQEVRKSLHRLSMIALKPNPLTDTEYIELLIQAEESEKKPGFLRRIACLSKIKKKAEHLGTKLDDERQPQRHDEHGNTNMTQRRGYYSYSL